MKRLVLSEGRRDVRFIELFYETVIPDSSIDTFYGEDIAYSRLKNQESEAIRNFLERRNPYDVLAKSENGKDDLKTVFSKLARFLAKCPIDVTLLIDLDRGTLNGLMDDLDTRVDDTYEGRRLGLREVERVDQSQTLVAHKIELYSKTDDERLDTFDIVAFHHDLETSIALEDADDDSDVERKLRDLVTDEQATGPLRSVLL